uniref:7TM_GPCR_Srx domain-containing protein n=1 Tax=Steinernema glaseri TaxID=37863 RepID=A0A1I7YHS1_9BILA
MVNRSLQTDNASFSNPSEVNMEFGVASVLNQLEFYVSILAIIGYVATFVLIFFLPRTLRPHKICHLVITFLSGLFVLLLGILAKPTIVDQKLQFNDFLKEHLSSTAIGSVFVIIFTALMIAGLLGAVKQMETIYPGYYSFINFALFFVVNCIMNVLVLFFAADPHVVSKLYGWHNLFIGVCLCSLTIMMLSFSWFLASEMAACARKLQRDIRHAEGIYRERTKDLLLPSHFYKYHFRLYFMQSVIVISTLVAFGFKFVDSSMMEQLVLLAVTFNAICAYAVLGRFSYRIYRRTLNCVVEPDDVDIQDNEFYMF